MMGHRALRECYPHRSPLLFLSALAAFFILTYRFTAPHPSVVVLASPPLYSPDLLAGNDTPVSTALAPGTHKSPNAGSNATPTEPQRLPLDPGLPQWMRYFDTTPVHVKESDAPANDALFKGVLPRFWTTKGGGDERLDGVQKVKKPDSVDKIIGLVFYGRRDRVSILECYLKRNLAKYGGVLDEVIFLARTKNADDLRWLDETIAHESAYKKWKWDGKAAFSSSYEMVQNRSLYVKIDDDIVWIDDNAIATIVDAKLRHPEYYLVGANVINQPMLSWVHWRLGAIHPFLPELRPFFNDRSDGRTEWRTNGLPTWNGSSKFDFPIDWMPPLTADQLPSDADLEALRKSPTPPSLPTPKPTESTLAQHLERIFRAPELPMKLAASPKTDSSLTTPKNTPLQYRWLPLRGETRHGPDDTPIRKTEYHPFGPGWSRWTIAAQEHYSFFANLEANEVSRYKFGTWDFNYDRMGIQFMAMMGSDINAAKPIEKDDERHLSETMTKRTKRHGIVDGRALVSHYSFNNQKKGLQATDILERYRAFAQEHICETPMKYPYP